MKFEILLTNGRNKIMVLNLFFPFFFLFFFFLFCLFLTNGRNKIMVLNLFFFFLSFFLSCVIKFFLFFFFYIYLTVYLFSVQNYFLFIFVGEFGKFCLLITQKSNELLIKHKLEPKDVSNTKINKPQEARNAEKEGSTTAATTIHHNKHSLRIVAEKLIELWLASPFCSNLKK
jgi:hypothetical protein